MLTKLKLKQDTRQIQHKQPKREHNRETQTVPPEHKTMTGNNRESNREGRGTTHMGVIMTNKGGYDEIPPSGGLTGNCPRTTTVFVKQVQFLITLMLLHL